MKVGIVGLGRMGAAMSVRLRQQGFEVVASVGDVGAAIRTTRGYKPDVLVLDLNMPGTVASLDDAMFYFNSGVAETAIDILRGEGWGKYFFKNLNVDNESRGFDRAVLRCESSAYTRPFLDIDGLEASQVGKSSALIELVDGPVGNGWYPSRLNARHLLCYSQDQGTVLRVDGPNWFGRIDTTLLKGPYLDYRGPAKTQSPIKVLTELEAK